MSPTGAAADLNFFIRSSLKSWIVYRRVHVSIYQSDATNASLTCFFPYTWTQQICYCDKEPTSFSSPTPRTSRTSPVTRITVRTGAGLFWWTVHTQLRLRYQNHRGGRSYWEVSAEHQTKTNEISIIVHFQFACFNRPVSNQTIWSHQGPRGPTSRRYRCSEHRLHYTDSIWTLLYTVLI